MAWGPDGVPERATLIKVRVCNDLRAWLGSRKNDPSLDQVIAVHVLTHETMHMVGIVNEARTECAAVQRDAAMADGARRVAGTGERPRPAVLDRGVPAHADGLRGGLRTGRRVRRGSPHSALAPARLTRRNVGGWGPSGGARGEGGRRVSLARVHRIARPHRRPALQADQLARRAEPAQPARRRGHERRRGRRRLVHRALPDPRRVPQHRAGLERPEPARAGRARPLGHGPRAHPRHLRLRRAADQLPPVPARSLAVDAQRSARRVRRHEA